MKNTGIIIVCVTFGMFMMMGCVKHHYMETETPQGTVPPATLSPQPANSYIPPKAAPSGNQDRTAPVASANTATAYQPANSSNDAGSARSSGGSIAQEENVSQGTIERFRKVYRVKEKPTIAIFLNRQFSDEVREWRTMTRRVATGGRTTVTQKDQWDKTTTEVEGDRSAYTQQHVETVARPGPGEEWMWAFEDGFFNTFLSSNTRLVDRATIMRLAAAKSGKQGEAYDLIAVKQIEMDALLDHADIYIEILITRSPSSLYGYIFKATAKEVKTGIIIAQASSVRWREKVRTGRVVAATSEGYKVADVIEVPPLYEVSEDLAVDLMNSLANSWSE